MFVIIGVIMLLLNIVVTLILWRTAKEGINFFSLQDVSKHKDIIKLQYIISVSLIISILANLFLGLLIIQLYMI